MTKEKPECVQACPQIIIKRLKKKEMGFKGINGRGRSNCLWQTIPQLRTHWKCLITFWFLSGCVEWWAVIGHYLRGQEGRTVQIGPGASPCSILKTNKRIVWWILWINMLYPFFTTLMLTMNMVQSWQKKNIKITREMGKGQLGQWIFSPNFCLE